LSKEKARRTDEVLNIHELFPPVFLMADMKSKMPSKATITVTSQNYALENGQRRTQIASFFTGGGGAEGRIQFTF
jgi:hypothetical protein